MSNIIVDWNIMEIELFESHYDQDNLIFIKIWAAWLSLASIWR